MRKMKENKILFILFIFISKIQNVKNDINYKEIERICKLGKFDSYKRKENYTTLDEYYNDQISDESTTNEYIISFLLNGSFTKKLSKFSNKILFTITMIILSISIFLSYIIVLILWNNNICIFRHLKEREREKKKRICKYCGYITTIFLICSCVICCIITLSLNSKLKRDMNASLCALYHFTSHSMDGFSDDTITNITYPIFPGFAKYDESLSNTSSLINTELSNTNIFQKYSDIINEDVNILNKIEEYSINYAKTKIIQSPSPFYKNTVALLLIYQELFGPYTSSNTILGQFYNEYINNINAAVNSLKNLKTDIDNIKTYSSEIQNYISKIMEEFDGFENLYMDIYNVIGKNYKKLKDKISTKIFLFIKIIFYLILFESFLVLLFLSCFICGNESTKCMYYVKIFFFIFWNFMFFTTICIFILNCFLSFYITLNKETIPVFNFMLSNEYMKNTSDNTNIFLNEIKTNILFPYYFQSCLNGKSSNSNLGYLFGIDKSYLKYINSLYVDYTDFKNYSLNIESTLSNIKLIWEKNSIFEEYKNNITKTTNYSYYKENDVKYNFDILNSYTDSSYPNSHQIECIVSKKDYWVSIKGDCPNNYQYLSNEDLFNEGQDFCLILNEWTYNEQYIRYSSACKTYNNENLDSFTSMYFDALKNFDNNNKELINNIMNANNNIYDLIVEISKDLITEYKNDLFFFENFLYNYIKYNGLIKSSTIYDMFDCSILRYDLIDFYDIAINKFNKNGLIQIILIAIAEIVLYISQYFSVRVIYVFDKDFNENYNEEESEEEDEIEDDDDILKNKNGNKMKSNEKFELESNNHLSSVSSKQNEIKGNEKENKLLLNKNPTHINYFTANQINRNNSEFTSTESSKSSSQNKMFKTKRNYLNNNESEEKNLKNSQSLVNNGNIRALYKNTSLKNQLKLSTQKKTSSNDSIESPNFDNDSNKEKNANNSDYESENEDKLSEEENEK